jgi:hypothetical protein
MAVGVGFRVAAPNLRLDHFGLHHFTLCEVLPDDRGDIGGGEVAVVNPIAGDFFLDFGGELVAEGFGQEGPVAETSALCGLEYHCHGASRAMIQTSSGFDLYPIAQMLPRHFLHECVVNRATAAIQATACGLIRRSVFGADEKTVLGGGHGMNGWVYGL